MCPSPWTRGQELDGVAGADFLHQTLMQADLTIQDSRVKFTLRDLSNRETMKSESDIFLHSFF